MLIASNKQMYQIRVLEVSRPAFCHWVATSNDYVEGNRMHPGHTYICIHCWMGIEVTWVIFSLDICCKTQEIVTQIPYTSRTSFFSLKLHEPLPYAPHDHHLAWLLKLIDVISVSPGHKDAALKILLLQLPNSKVPAPCWHEREIKGFCDMRGSVFMRHEQIRLSACNLCCIRLKG